MFLYKDNRFHFNNVSFCLPDNVYLNTNCDEYQECIEILPTDERFRIIIYVEQNKHCAEQFFGKDEAKECYCLVGVVTSFTISNVNGYFCSYKSSYNSYTEYRFNTDGGNVLGILVHRETDIDTSDIAEHPVVSNLLDSLKIE